jgi:hypothetical protein
MLSWLKGDKVDHPLADAKRAKEVIDAFPANDPWQTLEDAGHWLESITATGGFKLDKRFELLDALDVATRRAQRRLLDTYLALKPEDKIQERRIWNSVSKFSDLLGKAYLTCVEQARDGKNVSGAFKPNLPVIAARAMRSLRTQMKWALMRYSVVQPEIWTGIAACEAFAQAGGFADTAVDVYPGESERVRHEVARAAMLWIASPGGLSPLEQDIAERIIVYLSAQFEFSVDAPGDSSFYFEAGGQRPPSRLFKTTALSGAAWFFGAVGACQSVQAILAAIGRTGALPAAADLPLGAAANVTNTSRVLKHLLLNWAKDMRPRSSERRKTAMALEITHGYAKVLGAIVPECAEQGDGLDFANEPMHETWVAEDVSNGGYGMVAPAGKGDWLKVGVLVGIRAEGATSWSVGIVRRVTGDAYRQFRIGVQLIARAPLHLALRATGADRAASPKHALLLGAKPSPQGSLHILASRDIFSPKQLLDGAYGNPPVNVTLESAGAVEIGEDFDWLRYKLYEPI